MRNLGSPLPLVGGGTGASTLAAARAALGVDQTNNTSDANKPVSGPQQQALDAKASLSGAAFTGDIKTYRAGGLTGGVFLNQAGTRYLFNDGANYVLPGAELFVNNSQVWHTGTLQGSVNAGGAFNFAFRPTHNGANLATLADVANGTYLGQWNASTNAPALTTTPAANGAYYTVSVAGTQSVTGSSVAFAVGDQLKSNGTAWQRIPGSAPVTSVANKQGAVTLVAADVGLAFATLAEAQAGMRDDVMITPAKVAAEIVAQLLALPTTLPASANQMWWNGGVLSRS